TWRSCPGCGPTAWTRWRCGWRCSPATTAPTGSGPTTCASRGSSGWPGGARRWRHRPARALTGCGRRSGPGSVTTWTRPAPWRWWTTGRTRYTRAAAPTRRPRRRCGIWSTPAWAYACRWPADRQGGGEPPLTREATDALRGIRARGLCQDQPRVRVLLRAGARDLVPLGEGGHRTGPGRLRHLDRAVLRVVGHMQQVQHRSVRPHRQGLGLGTGGLAGGDLVGGVGVAPAGHLLHLLVEGAAERALLLQAGAAGVVHPEPGRSDLHRGLLGADLVPAYHQRSAVRDPERVGDLGRRRRPADLGEVLAVARG